MRKICFFLIFVSLCLTGYFLYRNTYKGFVLTKCRNKLTFYNYQWKNGGKIFPGKEISNLECYNLKNNHKPLTELLKKKDYSIFLLVRDVDCNLCINKIVNFLTQINKQHVFIGGVISLFNNNKNYVSRFLKINKIKFPVWFDEKNKIFIKLSVKTGPVIVLIDNRNQKIIFIGTLSPSNKDEAKHFFQYLKRIAN